MHGPTDNKSKTSTFIPKFFQPLFNSNKIQPKTAREEIHDIAVLNNGDRFKLIDNLTGTSYVAELILQDGCATVFGKKISTKPRNLLGKKEGSKVTISGKEFVIKEIKK